MRGACLLPFDTPEMVSYLVRLRTIASSKFDQIPCCHSSGNTARRTDLAHLYISRAIVFLMVVRSNCESCTKSQTSFVAVL